MSQSASTDILDSNQSYSNASIEDIEFYRDKVEALSEINKIKEYECKEANSLVIQFLQENINLERKLNKTTTDLNLILIDLKEKERDIQQLKSIIDQKDAEINNLKQQLKSKNENKDSSLIKQSRKQKLSSNNKSVLKNIKTIYETNILETLRKTRREIEPIFLNNISNIKTEKKHISTQTDENSNVEILEEYFNEIDIIEHNFDKQYVRLINRSDKEISLGNYEFISYLNGYELIKYKFHKAVSLAPSKCLTLWNNYSQFKKHYPPTDFVIDETINSSFNILTSSLDSNSSNLINDILLDENKNEVSRTQFILKIKEEIF